MVAAVGENAVENGQQGRRAHHAHGQHKLIWHGAVVGRNGAGYERHMQSNSSVEFRTTADAEERETGGAKKRTDPKCSIHHSSTSTKEENEPSSMDESQGNNGTFAIAVLKTATRWYVMRSTNPAPLVALCLDSRKLVKNQCNCCAVDMA